MVYAIILAAGIGKRFELTPIKPLFRIQNKPLFLHSVDTFLKNKNVDRVLVVINEQYEKEFRKNLKSYKNVSICFGDNNARWKSLLKGMNFLSKHFNLEKNDIILTHDAARIHVTNKIIDNNILVTKKYGYSSTILPIYDSVCEVYKTSKYINRQNKYTVQTPQTIQYQYWKTYKKINHRNATDLFTYLKLSISKKHLVYGHLLNFKITTKDDLSFIYKNLKSY